MQNDFHPTTISTVLAVYARDTVLILFLFFYRLSINHDSHSSSRSFLWQQTCWIFFLVHTRCLHYNKPQKKTLVSYVKAKKKFFKKWLQKYVSAFSSYSKQSTMRNELSFKNDRSTSSARLSKNTHLSDNQLN